MSRVLFIDYDNTLHDTEAQFASRLDGLYGLTSRQIVEVFLQVHREIVHVRHQDRHDDFFFHQRLICERLDRPYDEAEAREVARLFEAANSERWTAPWLFPDVISFLDAVREQHILCLTTGDYAREKADALEKAGGRAYFTHAFDHTHLGVKGSSLFFRNALSEVGAGPEDAVVIGDCPDQDIRAAGEIGISTIWVNRQGLTLPESSPAPDYTATGLREVVQHLDTMHQRR